MTKAAWVDKIKIIEGLDEETEMLSPNSFGICFNQRSETDLVVYFKPLNELFPPVAFDCKKGLLFNFERDLIEEDDIEYALDIMSLFNQSPELQLDQPHQVRQLQKVMDLVVEEYHNPNASYIMLKTLLKVLMLNLIRFWNKDFIKQDHNQKRLFQFLEMMEMSFMKHTDADFYAKQIGVSVKRLNQILKEKLDMTAKQIIQQRQITEAKRRLIKSEITIKELAFLLGFDSFSGFSRFFKKAVGESPSKFKARHS
ncbi:helix-turn-helix domain-containing protein [Zobellia uliginosa]|uniref:helix-turn-helix domain-containing protein n=1 Tax=Zobellia uliginosa TaxID=143224 RepID=UPI001C07CEA7|nr:helix-turn-helix domain-containing protein [Zobellia uliginosa]MBU2949017.1 helix-turn-helix domain-containing protein [Zobellia uliginosa]